MSKRNNNSDLLEVNHLIENKVNKLKEMSKINCDIKSFVKSRFDLGLLLEKQKKYPEAEQAFQEIKREDDKQIFAISRFNLGLLLEKQEKYPEAEQAYREIQKEDDKEKFTNSRFNLGLLLEKQEKYAEAEQAYTEIQKEDDKKQFSMSRFNLGLLLEKQRKYTESELAYKEIKSEDDKQTFAMSRVNLGVVLEKQEKYEEAEQVYKVIKREDDKKHFAMSRFNLGILLGKQEKYTKAEQAYREIKREDDKQLFAKSRNNLGILLDKKGKHQEAIETFREVSRSDSSEDFAVICVNLGVLLKKYNKLTEAKEVLGNITKHDGKSFFKAKFAIGEIYIEEGEYDNAKIAFKESKENYYYDSERLIKILEISNQDISKHLINLLKNISSILNCLRLDNKYEKYICHYTRPSTAFALLKDDKGDEKASKLRLSTIKNVNDPTEGRVLFDYLKLPNKEIGLGSFISCFTFNHDSLNQFRLYGKENNQEASGVSIVFKKDFFGEYLKSCNFIEYGGRRLSNNSFFFGDGLNVNKSIENNINKLPVYRCIYIDNKYDYIKLAKRSEIDFYREGESNSFISYLYNINKKEVEVKDNLNKIREILRVIEGDQYFNESMYDVINYILLPLKFLVKHAAFEDEQECRMFFITDLFDDRIQSNFNEKSMYLEYEPLVRENIKEIYLSIGAYQYEDFFVRSLRDSSKVCRSRNPFRNK